VFVALARRPHPK